MNIKYATIRSKKSDSSKLEVLVSDTNRPFQQDYRANVDFQVANSSWEKTLVCYDIMPDKKMDWKVFAHTCYFNSMPKESYLDVQGALVVGINVPVERLRLKVDCLTECDGMCGKCTDGKIYLILLPDVADEKKEDELVADIENIIFREYQYNRQDPYVVNKFQQAAKEIIKYFKTKNITNLK